MVSESTRARVLSAAAQLGYVANGAARALARRCSRTVGAIVPRFGSSSFSATVQALESTLAGAGFTLLLSAPDHERLREPMTLRTLLEHGVDAVALLGADHGSDTYALLARHRVPFVLLWTQPSDPTLPAIGFDEGAAGELLVSHLVSLGHRAIGFIGGRTRDNERARRRFQGVVRAVAGSGIRLLPEAVVETDYGFREGYDAMKKIVATRARITAVLCGNDYLAGGALAACHEAGVEVPASLSVASYNDNEFAAFLQPPLTTVRLPVAEIGRAAAAYLIDRLAGRDAVAPSALPIELVVRKSTGRAPSMARSRRVSSAA
jgi:LacI family transcriptional regulator